MFLKRFIYLLVSIGSLFILTGWQQGPHLEAGGQLFVTGVQAFFGYVVFAGIGTIVFFLTNRKTLKEPETEPEFWKLALRLFKLFWVIPTVFFIIILALLFAYEVMGPVLTF